MIRAVIADDEQWVLTIIKSLLKGMGEDAPIIVGEAGDGLRALALCEMHKPELLITDIRMPGLSGLELIEKISALSLDLKIIIISGYTDFEHARKALALHAFDYLLKPIDEEALTSCVRRAESAINGERRAAGQAVESEELTQEDSVDRAFLYMQEHFHKPLTLESVAQSVFLNPNYFSGIFKKRKGVTFHECLTALRMEKARQLVLSGMWIYEVSERVGYKDPKYFAKLFKKNYGCKPGKYRKLHGTASDKTTEEA